jgi:hypothetical protein
MFVEYDTLGRQYSVSALMKQDNICMAEAIIKMTHSLCANPYFCFGFVSILTNIYIN